MKTKIKKIFLNTIITFFLGTNMSVAIKYEGHFEIRENDSQSVKSTYIKVTQFVEDNLFINESLDKNIRNLIHLHSRPIQTIWDDYKYYPEKTTSAVASGLFLLNSRKLDVLTANEQEKFKKTYSFLSFLMSTNFTMQSKFLELKSFMYPFK